MVRFALVMEVYAREISEDNKLVSQLESLLDENRVDSQKISEIDRAKHQQGMVIQTQILNQKCQKASLEYTYIKNLLNSKYNKSFRYTVPPASSTELWQDVCRTKALNIRNSAQYIENIKYINSNRVSRIARRQQEEIKELQKESKLLQEELKALQKDSKDLLEKSKGLQEQSRNSIYQIRHTESVNGVMARFSVFLAITFGFSPIVTSVVNYFKKQEAIEWTELVFDGILIIGAIYYIWRYCKISKKKGNN